MVKLSAADKQKIKEGQEIEAQLRASANGASKLVSSWLGSDDSDSEDKDDSSKAKKAKDIFKGRPARLGVGAKFIPHSAMVASQHGIMTSEELKLKRKLTGKREISSGAGGETDSQTRAKEQDSDSDEDSKSKILSSTAATRNPPNSLSGSLSSGGGGGQLSKKKKSKTNDFLDSMMKRRKR